MVGGGGAANRWISGVIYCLIWHWILVFGACNSMDIRGDLLLILGSVFVLFGGPWWSRKSMDTRGDLLFILVLVSSGLVLGNRWILGVI